MEKGRGGLLPGAARVKLVVCEDGDEYTARFRRFLGGEFEFVRAAGFTDALRALPGAAGLLLDLDFKRAAALVDEHGAPASRAAAEVQGILILRALRSRGVRLPALLFADLDDAQRVQRLQSELAPLEIVSSSEGLPRIAERLRRLSNQQSDR